MREINKAGANNHTSINAPAPSRPRRRFNIKKFIGSLLFFTVLISLAVWGIHFVAEKKNSSEPPRTKTDEAAADNVMPANNEGSTGIKVVLDAGHGGFDPGATGISGTVESSLNLIMAEDLKEELEGAGMQVIMTRSDEDAIAPTKDEDMAKRREITEDENPELFISIHMNSLEDHTVFGPIVLFQPGSVRGEELAKAIEDAINGNVDTLKSCTHRSGELIVLRGNTQPSVLIECGFISNRDEEAKLLDESYRKQFAKAICLGLEEFLGKGQLS